MLNSKYFCTLLFVCLPFLYQVHLNAQINIGLLNGGNITAQYDDSPAGEGVKNVIDNSVNTKFLTFHNKAWIVYKAPGSFVLKKYAVISANDSPERDPKDWILEGSADGTSWTQLDTKAGITFPSRFLRREYSITNTAEFSYYRITLTCSSGTVLQLSEWELWIDPLPHDAGVTSVSAPVPHPLSAVSPKVSVINSGANTESFNVGCRIYLDGTQVYQQTMNVNSLQPGNSETLNFTAWTPTVDKMYKVTAWTELAGDQLKSNDTLSIVTNTSKKMYMVGYAHLDLQWNWDLGTTTSLYIPSTMKDNFALFDKYPQYRFTFEGAYRYMIMKKKYPADYEKVKKYVASGQWNIGGSMIESPDVITPSAESLMRQILYGNNFFKEEFGKTSIDVLLPDCFGFPISLPTIAVHCGLKGFSSQKFDRWGGFRSSPFSIGTWEGIDGSRLTAVLKPGAYDDGPQIRATDVNALGASTGLYWGYDYYGTGDRGGAPSEDKVISLMAMLADTKSDIQAVPSSSDQIFRDLTDEQIKKFDVYKGELLMTQHGSGCYTSQANMKKLNRQNELTAGSAERASVMAELFSGTSYPQDALKQSWINFLCHQFHDDLTGTSISSAYDSYSLPDEKASLASFTQILNTANTAIASKLDTRVDDTANSIPVVVYNPLAGRRHDIAEVSVAFTGTVPKAIKVYDKNGTEVPSQIRSVTGSTLKIVFAADIPGSGYSVYQVKRSAAPSSIATGLKVTANSLENLRYKVEIDDFGDLSSIFDKKLGKELLQGSSGFEVRDDKSQTWPAWEVLYEDVISVPRSFVMQGTQKTVTDSGAAQVTVKVTRTNEGSSFTHFITLTADTAGFVKVDNIVDWKASDPNGSLLKVSFPLTASNPYTTYDLGIGAYSRGVNYSRLYEVPGQQWADITSTDKSYGVAILNNCKYGWDKPANNTINLTLIHSPNGTSYNYRNDLYVHDFTYAVYSHAGDWADGQVVFAGERLNQPLVTFQTTPHNDGGLGREFSFVSADPSKVAIMAVKKAEYGSEYIIRVRETSGKSWQNVQLTFPGIITSAQEVNGMEEFKGAADFNQNTITFNIGPFQPKTFSVKLKNVLTSVSKEETSLPQYDLSQNYPNPFNPVTVINYSIAKAGPVTLKIYDLLGREVKALVDGINNAGKHSVSFDASSLPSGIYFCQIKADTYNAVKKMMLIK
ncbi:MAG: glycoside hydrolase family 38 C-terminal domain-containing protein [Syntrophothermus sp.]